MSSPVVTIRMATIIVLKKALIGLFRCVDAEILLYFQSVGLKIFCAIIIIISIADRFL